MKLIKVTSKKQAQEFNVPVAVKARRGRKPVQLDIPKGDFTVGDLKKRGAGISDIAIFQKVRKMLKDGTIKKVGEKKQDGVGRPSAVYQLAE